MFVYKKSGRFIVKLGGTAEVKAFVPGVGIEAFFILFLSIESKEAKTEGHNYPVVINYLLL